MKIVIPRLRQTSRGTRANKLSPAAPMLTRWRRDASMTPIEALRSLVNWMDVENSYRWKPRWNEKLQKNNTFCDCYAEDFLDQLSKGTIPIAGSIWWTDDSLKKIQAGEGVRVIWPDTVKSLGARGLNLWLRDWGTYFGWESFEDEASFYKALNERDSVVGVISDEGHITVALPDSVAPEIKKSGSVPLQTQAGSTNKKLFRSNSWYKASPNKGFYLINF